MEGIARIEGELKSAGSKEVLYLENIADPFYAVEKNLTFNHKTFH